MLQEKGCSSCLFQKEPWIHCGFLNFVFVLIFFFFYARSTMHYNLRNVKEKLPEICHSKIHIVPDNPSDSLELHTY